MPRATAKARAPSATAYVNVVGGWLPEPDIILPVQFFATVHRQAVRKMGERQLLIALLEDAVGCFQQHVHATKNPGRRLFREAELWFMSSDQNASAPEGQAAITFPYVCDVLGLDPGVLRAELQRWRAAQGVAVPRSTAVVERRTQLHTPVRRVPRGVTPALPQPAEVAPAAPPAA